MFGLWLLFLRIVFLRGPLSLPIRSGLAFLSGDERNSRRNTYNSEIVSGVPFRGRVAVVGCGGDSLSVSDF